MKAPKVGVFGHYGNQNLGDEAITEATIQNLRSLVPGIEIVGLSINPFDTGKRYNIPVFPIRYRADFFRSEDKPDSTSERRSSPAKDSGIVFAGISAIKSIVVIRRALSLLEHIYRTVKNLGKELFFLRKSRAQLKTIDLLLVCGSNQFLDNFGGPWGFPYTLLKWTLLAKTTRTKVAFVSVGAGPIYKSLSFRLLGPALRMNDYLSYRDLNSKHLIESRISGVDGQVCPDLAHGLIDRKLVEIPERSGNQPVIAINPMPVYSKNYWYKTDEDKYHNYVSNLADFSLALLDKDCKVVLFNTQLKDLNVIDDVLAAIEGRGRRLETEVNLTIERHDTLAQLMNTLQQSTIVVATRFHATVLPLQLSKPVLGICYYRKARDQLDDVSLNGFYVDIEDFSYRQLLPKIDQLLENRESFEQAIAKKFKIYQAQLDHQWQEIVQLLPAQP